MLATGLGLQDARAVLAAREQLVSVGAINSPGAVTLSGDAATLNEISKELEEKGIFSRFLEVEVPYHSPHMEALKVEMRDVLRDLRPRNPSVRLYSTVTGRLVDGATHNAEYWCNNMREPVLFADAVSSILAHGYAGFLEVGPHPVLANSIKEAQRHARTHAHRPQVILTAFTGHKGQRPALAQHLEDGQIGVAFDERKHRRAGLVQRGTEALVFG